MPKKVMFEHGGKSVSFFESNGQWRHDVWDKIKKRMVPYYFGSVADDPDAKRAMYGQGIGWLVREGGIRKGTDRVVRAAAVGAAVGWTIGQLIQEFMRLKHDALLDGRLADSTFRDYDHELSSLGDWRNIADAQAEAVATSPAIFSAYARHLTAQPSADDSTARGLGLDRRASAMRYVRAFFNWMKKNDRVSRVTFGSDFDPPSTDPDSKAVRNERLGLADDDDNDESKMLTAKQVAWLLNRASPLFRGMILLALNCGFGPTDLARLKWKHIDLTTGRLSGPRRRKGKSKAGIRREGFLWPETVAALKRVRELKHCRIAFEKEGRNALVFLTRKGHPVVRNERKIADGRIANTDERNAVSGTFGKWIREAEGKGIIPPDSGLGFYNLRHTFRTHADNCVDLNAVRRVMGRKVTGMDHRYIHGKMPLFRLWRVSKAVRRRVLPDALPLEKPVKPVKAPRPEMAVSGRQQRDSSGGDDVASAG